MDLKHNLLTCSHGDVDIQEPIPGDTSKSHKNIYCHKLRKTFPQIEDEVCKNCEHWGIDSRLMRRW